MKQLANIIMILSFQITLIIILQHTNLEEIILMVGLTVKNLTDERRHKQWKPKEQIFHKISYNIDEDTYSNNNYIERFYEKITNKGMPQGPYLENAFDEYYHTSRTNMGSDIKMEGEKYNTQLILAYNQYVRTKETKQTRHIRI